MKKWVTIILTTVFLAGVLAACGTSNKEENNSTEGGETKKVLKMGTSADFPPFEYIDTAKGDEIIGLDVDIANTIAERLGYEISFVDMEFSGLITGLQSKQIDIVFAMTPTKERMKTVDFSDIYYEAQHMIVTKKDSGIEKKEDLNGKAVGVHLASTQETFANDLIANEGIEMKVENRNRVPEVIQEILAGRFDAAIMEDTVANGYIKNNADLVGHVIPSEEQDTGSAIVFQKGSELRDQFNEELNKMKENGELEELVLKWIGGETK